MQQFSGKDFSGRLEAEALSRRVVVSGDEIVEAARLDGVEVGLARQVSSQAADGVLDGALLPGTVGVAEEGADCELVVEEVVLGELGAVVEGDGFAQAAAKRPEPVEELLGSGLRCLAGLPCQQDQTGLSFVRDEDGLARGGKHHEIGFPVAEGGAALDGMGPQIDRNTALDEVVGGAPAATGRASLVAALGEIVAPSSVVGAADLGVDEAVDALVADRCGGFLLAQPAGDLPGRPAALKLAKHEPAQLGVVLQARAVPAPGTSLLVGISRLVADLCPGVPLQLASDCRWRVIHSCRDLADRLPSFAKLGNRASLVEAELAVMFTHGNTFV